MTTGSTSQTTTARRADRRRPPRRAYRPGGSRLTPYLFILPNMVIFGLFSIWPAINGFNISLYSSTNGRRFEWAGLGNYREISADAEFWGALQNTLVYVAAFVVLSVVGSVLLAVALNAQLRGRSAFRAVFFLPVLLSPVVVGIMWRWMLERRGGLVNAGLDGLGIGEVPWLVDGTIAMGVTIFVGLWTHLGFYTMITLAGLQSIDGSLYEAASVDGAGASQQFRSLTLPLLLPTVMVVLILSTINGFQAFDFIYNLTGGGPVGATTLLVQYVYDNAFGPSSQYGLASAASVILFLVVLTFTLVNWWFGRKQEAA